MTEEDLQRWRRAKEVLNDAGWVFDQFVSQQMAELLASTKPDEVARRERLYLRAKIATELKLNLISEVEHYEAEVKITERREQAREQKNGRRDQHLN